MSVLGHFGEETSVGCSRYQTCREAPPSLKHGPSYLRSRERDALGCGGWVDVCGGRNGDRWVEQVGSVVGRQYVLLEKGDVFSEQASNAPSASFVASARLSCVKAQTSVSSVHLPSDLHGVPRLHGTVHHQEPTAT